MERYTLGELLGSGADGKVYFAHRAADHQRVCLKQIPQDKLFQKESGKNEIAAYQKMSHPNIPTYFEHFVEKNLLTIVIEYAEGDMLRNIIYYHKAKKIPIPEQMILQVFSQMTSALKYLKSLGIIYCDVKPENILLDREGHLKLIDFGTAKAANSKLKKAFAFGGTLAYMSPEMLSDNGYSFETDVWSLGVVLFEMMTHVLPFGSKPEKEVVRKIQNVEAPEIKSDYSAPLKAAVKQMLRKRPGARASIENLEKLGFLPQCGTELTPRQWNNWGIKHKYGLGVRADAAEAARFFKMSADAGCTTGMFNYCFSVLNSGKRQEALEYLKRAADRGNIDALLNYALALEQGWGGGPDLAEAKRYYKLSADAGNTESMCTYAIACTEGWDGEPNLAEAVEYYRMAAERGDPFAMFNFANALAGGLTGPINRAEAMNWYKRAADAGDTDAMFNYGACLSHAWGGEPDLPGAMKYFKMAADKGNLSGIYNYGWALEHGYSGTADLQGALRYYQMAAEKGHVEAKDAYKRLGESRLPSLHAPPK
jgi:TPR repeat protein